MNISRFLIISATVGFAIAAATPALSQSTRNIGNGNNVGTNNIGTPGNGGGGVAGCVNVTLAGATNVRVCQSGYIARLGNIICSGSVSQGFGRYTLYQAPCNQAGQAFLGGSLNCGGNTCYWNPSAAGRAQGYRSEGNLYAYYD